MKLREGASIIIIFIWTLFILATQDGCVFSAEKLNVDIPDIHTEVVKNGE